MLLSPKKPIKGTSSNDKMDGSVIVNSNLSVKENSDKTTLINRIAKLGQPILPSGPIVVDGSDSEQVYKYFLIGLKRNYFLTEEFSCYLFEGNSFFT